MAFWPSVPPWRRAGRLRVLRAQRLHGSQGRAQEQVQLPLEPWAGLPDDETINAVCWVFVPFSSVFCVPPQEQVGSESTHGEDDE